MNFVVDHWAGWVKGPESDRALLIALGMRGPMIHDGKNFTYCHVPDWNTMLVLMEFYPGFWHPAFTALDKDGKQYERKQQC